MPSLNITSRWVDRVHPGEALQVDYFDTAVRGFGLRVSRTGRKSWFCMYRHSGRLRRHTLGTYPALSLKEARDMARTNMEAVAKGTDPALEKKRERLAESFAELADLYLEKYAKQKKRSWKEDDRIIRRNLLKPWGRRKANAIKRRDVIELLDGIVERGSPIQANRVLALIRKIYNWSIERDLVEFNPCTQVKAPGKEHARDRVLTEDEIRAVWKALDSEDVQIGSIFKLRLLTAQRGGEVESMRWQDIDLQNGWWTIPGEIAKNGLSHRVPLSSNALELLNNLKATYSAIDKSSDWVFPSPTRKGKHIANIQKAAGRIRDASGVEFVPHDLRRTAASYMTGMDISRVVVGKILNHVESGVTQVYDRHSYDSEKRQALNRWSRHLIQLVTGEADNVIYLLPDDSDANSLSHS